MEIWWKIIAHHSASINIAFSYTASGVLHKNFYQSYFQKFQTKINEKFNAPDQEATAIFTDCSKLDGKVGCEIHSAMRLLNIRPLQRLSTVLAIIEPSSGCSNQLNQQKQNYPLGYIPTVKSSSDCNGITAKRLQGKRIGLHSKNFLPQQ